MIGRQAKEKPRSPVRLDVELGKRIRVARLEAGMTQSTLADRLGVSFQQVQKYEKGINRVNANRLSLVAAALKIPTERLYQPQGIIEDVDSLIDVTNKSTLRMLRAYGRIADQATQRQMVVLIETIAAAADQNG